MPMDPTVTNACAMMLIAVTIAPTRSWTAIVLPHCGLRRIEFESGRLLQAQILFLKDDSLMPFRDAVSAELERRHVEIRKIWADTLESVGITVRQDR